MRLVTTDRGENLSDLIARLFDVAGPGGAETARAAEAALLGANPHLRDFKKLPAGLLIVVPRAGVARPTGRARPLPAATRELIDETRRAVSDLRARLDASATDRIEEAMNTLNLLKSRKLKTVLREPALAERLSVVTEAVRAGREEAKALRTLHQKALGELEREVGDLVSALLVTD